MLKNIALERVNNLIKIINVHRLIIDQLHKLKKSDNKNDFPIKVIYFKVSICNSITFYITHKFQFLSYVIINIHYVSQLLIYVY